MHTKKHKLDYQLYLQKENHFLHQPYRNEYNFYEAVAHGDLQYIEYIKNKYPVSEQENNGKGELSADPVRNERYHFIVNVAIITRKCIEFGLPQEKAYTLSDLYIRTSDTLHTIQELRQLNDDMVMDYALLMKNLHKKKFSSPYILQCVKYIDDHLHAKVTISDIAEELGLNACYLSTLFKKETGITIHSYLQKKRLETAANILSQTDHTYSSIANTLGYSSQSHFIQVFHKYYGITPAQYRKQHANRP